MSIVKKLTLLLVLLAAAFGELPRRRVAFNLVVHALLRGTIFPRPATVVHTTTPHSLYSAFFSAATTHLAPPCVPLEHMHTTRALYYVRRPSRPEPSSASLVMQRVCPVLRNALLAPIPQSTRHHNFTITTTTLQGHTCSSLHTVRLLFSPRRSSRLDALGLARLRLAG